MASLPTTKRVTYEEWLEMPVVEDATEEVVDGEIRIMPPHKWDHARVVDNLGFEFAPQVEHRREKVATSEFGLIIRKAPLTSRVPDMAVFDLSTIVERDGYIHSAPQLVAEVRSSRYTPDERDRKFMDYASLGVPELWDVVPNRRTVEILLLEDGQLRRSAILTEGFLKPTHFPNVRIDIAKIWPD